MIQSKAKNNVLRGARDRSGSVVLVFALLLPALAAVSVGVADYAMALRQKSLLQRVVDAATLAAASELSMSNMKTDNVQSIVQSLVENHMKAVYANGDYPKPSVATSIRKEPLQVKVIATQRFESFLGDGLGMQSRDLNATSVAQVVGQPNICVLALSENDSAAVDLKQSTKVTATDCAVFSNSTSTSGIMAKDLARMSATTICSAGGVSGHSENFDPYPYMDCPTFEDPLANRTEPPVGACNPNQQVEYRTSAQLSPGTYCGLTVTNGAVVTFRPGVYVIKDKPLVVTGGGKIIGQGVGFYFTGAEAVLLFLSNSSVELEAPTGGLMSGLLVFASRDGAYGNKHRIQSKNAQKLVGTIYAPTGELSIDGDASVGGLSAYTAIVVKKVVMFGGPHVQLNTNYDETDVPVPEGIKGAGQPVQLMQ